MRTNANPSTLEVLLNKRKNAIMVAVILFGLTLLQAYIGTKLAEGFEPSVKISMFAAMGLMVLCGFFFEFRAMALTKAIMLRRSKENP